VAAHADHNARTVPALLVDLELVELVLLLPLALPAALAPAALRARALHRADTALRDRVLERAARDADAAAGRLPVRAPAGDEREAVRVDDGLALAVLGRALLLRARVVEARHVRVRVPPRERERRPRGGVRGEVVREPARRGGGRGVAGRPPRGRERERALQRGRVEEDDVRGSPRAPVHPQLVGRQRHGRRRARPRRVRLAPALARPRLRQRLLLRLHLLVLVRADVGAHARERVRVRVVVRVGERDALDRPRGLEQQRELARRRVRRDVRREQRAPRGQFTLARVRADV
jgi:hypothetical protein